MSRRYETTPTASSQFALTVPLYLIADTSFSGARVGPEFDALVRLNCKPARIVSDNGT